MKKYLTAAIIAVAAITTTAGPAAATVFGSTWS